MFSDMKKRIGKYAVAALKDNWDWKVWAQNVVLLYEFGYFPNLK